MQQENHALRIWPKIRCFTSPLNPYPCTVKISRLHTSHLRSVCAVDYGARLILMPVVTSRATFGCHAFGWRTYAASAHLSAHCERWCCSVLTTRRAAAMWWFPCWRSCVSLRWQCINWNLHAGQIGKNVWCDCMPDLLPATLPSGLSWSSFLFEFSNNEAHTMEREDREKDRDRKREKRGRRRQRKREKTDEQGQREAREEEEN